VTFSELLKTAAARLQEQKIPFVVGGTLVASIYRLEKRAMNHVSLLVDCRAQDLSFFSGLFPEPYTEFQLPDSNPIDGFKTLKSISDATGVLVLGANKQKNLRLELVMPSFPWFSDAFSRAQYNCLDFSFATLPTMTVEDIIIAKLYSATVGEHRYLDLDDVLSILRAAHPLDLSYLTNSFNRLKLDFPRSLWSDAPEGLRRIARSASK